ncbi:MAG: hypothetical protein IJ968_05495 [Clostridia bacterium]|nr:hypothetical protein [Clostridia bacterium]
MKRVLVIFLALIMACSAVPAMAAVVERTGMNPLENYETGMVCFQSREYGKAAQYFHDAGNYKDAKKWAYYCEAIDDMICNSNDYHALEEAFNRFVLLDNLEFRDAGQWAEYCRGRQYEIMNNPTRAASVYAGICVHDSMERYLACKDGSDYLQKRSQEARQEAENAGFGSVSGMNGQELYERGMYLYNLGEYQLAADFFCLAGNYQDANKWRYYCEAVYLMTTEQAAAMDQAHAMFSVLEQQEFENVDEWILYLKGRSYEADRNWKKARECYGQVFVYDSAERYLNVCWELD